MKILITGSTGLLGQALSLRLAQSCDVTGVARHAPAVALAGRHLVCDLTDREQAARVVKDVAPDAVIHTQALSDVDRCEQEPALARRMNVEATANLVRALEGLPALLVYVSTDYVFDGRQQTPYVEASAPNPLSVYARSKLEGEQIALQRRGAVVVRPSTLFGPARINFCDAVVQAARERRTIEVFADQTTSPTYTEDCAEAIEALARLPMAERASRIYHVANAGACPRVTFAHRILELLGAPRDVARPVRMADQHRPAPRPAYSALGTTELPQAIGRRLRSWDDALQAYLHQRRWLN